MEVSHEAQFRGKNGPMVSAMPDERGRIKSLKQRNGLPSGLGVCWRSKGNNVPSMMRLSSSALVWHNL